MFTLDTAATSVNGLTLDEDGIAWASDDEKFKQPSGFKYTTVTDLSRTCADEGLPDTCKTYTDTTSSTTYYYYYPNDDTVQYLYESYPDQISPIIGVTDEHFKVWMRPAALPQFRKLYGEHHYQLYIYIYMFSLCFVISMNIFLRYLYIYLLFSQFIIITYYY